jgi:hypothetical protein
LGAKGNGLKTEKHPGNGQPDPTRTLLKFFPELVQQHKAAPSSVISQIENNFLAAPHEDIEPLETIKDEDLNQIVLIVASATSVPVSFDAIRKSRKWGEENKPSVRYERATISALVQAEKLHGSEKDGYRVNG